jgi:hypothetical protein
MFFEEAERGVTETSHASRWPEAGLSPTIIRLALICTTLSTMFCLYRL